MFRMSALVLAALLVSSAPAVPAETACKVSLRLFLAAKPGMSYRQVVRLFGCFGVESLRSEMPGYSIVGYDWSGNDDVFSTVNILFENDALSSKMQFGLH